ncbi:peptidoglycan DD-metalloendopeptidase family protein [Alteribacillus sp. HJP-4]|uniref:peptidoglycan DD-metalloendopeptidase family protein n=1 Tax=Alteribacillus sp. HJP-4 TaxID=2775394 RepID=UPI0035CCDA38
MNKQMHKVRKKVDQKRKKRDLHFEKERERQRSTESGFYPHHSDAPYHEPEFYMWRDQEDTNDTPKSRKGTWVIQGFAAVILFLLTGILFQSNHPALEDARGFVERSFEQEFPFAAASAWYEERFGSPLAFMPGGNTLEEPVANVPENNPSAPVIPVSGTVAETFSENGKGIILETGPNETIEAAEGGVIIHAGPHEEWGNAVAVQHYEGGEAWYGMLEGINVKLYDHVSSGTVIGSVEKLEEQEGGRYSFALKENGDYVDPSDVISFD